MTAKKIDKVLRSGALPGGHTVIVDLQIEGGEELTLECSHEKLPLLAVSIHDAGVVAERARNALPGQAVSTVVPHLAKGVRAGTADGDKYVLLLFQTEMGIPLQVAMTPELAQETIERLQNELGLLGRKPPIIRS